MFNFLNANITLKVYLDIEVTVNWKVTYDCSLDFLKVACSSDNKMPTWL